MRNEPWLISSISFLLFIGFFILRSIAPGVFPVYYLYLFLGVALFLIFSKLDFEILSTFSTLLFIGSVIFLTLPLLVGQITRGTIRWIPIGPLTIQPAEIIRPFILIFFAKFLTVKTVTVNRLFKAGLLFSIPFFLIVIQPSLGVAILTAIGFLGVVLSIKIDRRILLTGFITTVLLLPFSWFLLAPYQKTRVLALISPASDPRGAGYNSIQSMISVGSGKLFGRGLGEGVQTQLSFLPERHTDFVFASISEELGLLGSTLILFANLFLLYRIIIIAENSINNTAKAFASGVFLTLFAQIFVHIAMNMALLPITGIPLPLVSAGGSSLIATLTTLGIVIGTKKH